MSSKPYSNVCTISKACQILEPRWTLPILNQMWNGYTRFNDIRRAVGGVSPGVLSKRLEEMERNGLIERIEDRAKGTVDYVRTDKAIDLEEAMDSLSRWAQRNIESEVALNGSNISALMWMLRQAINVAELPTKRTIMQFHFSGEPEALKKYWLIYEPGTELELCIDPPGSDIDLFIETDQFTCWALFMGRTTFSREKEKGQFFMSGDALLERSIERWFPRSSYADVEGVMQLDEERLPTHNQGSGLS
ncbi:winged helix-turn-helix transcriptional regulator [Marimonas sp. MJW-29]|uniref:Winged helix-turn-helix transcriptional regulator n=1 Tax=Sulfitobacter sediminis TaxID=3234186 RepID=A0ABV3RU41_9RHOB